MLEYGDAYDCVERAVAKREALTDAEYVGRFVADDIEIDDIIVVCRSQAAAIVENETGPVASDELERGPVVVPFEETASTAKMFARARRSSLRKSSASAPRAYEASRFADDCVAGASCIDGARAGRAAKYLENLFELSCLSAVEIVE